MAFLEGYGIGLAMVVFLGPVFFTLLKSSLQYGFKGGISVALGIFTSDILCVMLCMYGAVSFFKNPDNQFFLGIGGSIVLFALGLKYLLRPTLYNENEVSFKSHHYSAFFAKGFIVNFVNPFVFLVWIGVIGLARAKHESTADVVTFVSGALSGILTTDTLKVIFAHRLKALIKPKLLTNIYKVIGIVLIIFGIRMVWLVL